MSSDASMVISNHDKLKHLCRLNKHLGVLEVESEALMCQLNP